VTQTTMTAAEFKRLSAEERKPKAHRDKSHAMPMPAGAHITREGDTVKATLAFPPSDNSITRHAARMVKGEPLSMDYPSGESKQYARSVKELAKDKPCVPLKGEVAVEVTLYRPRKTGDVYRCKLLLDTLQGIAYENDSQVRELSIKQRDDKERPRVEVVVWKLAKKELFE